MATMKDMYFNMVNDFQNDNKIVFALYDSNFPNVESYVKKYVFTDSIETVFRELIDSIYNEVDDTTEETNDIIDMGNRYTVFINSKYVFEVEQLARKLYDYYNKIPNVCSIVFDAEFFKPFLVSQLVLESIDSVDTDFFVIDTE